MTNILLRPVNEQDREIAPKNFGDTFRYGFAKNDVTVNNKMTNQFNQL